MIRFTTCISILFFFFKSVDSVTFNELVVGNILDILYIAVLSISILDAHYDVIFNKNSLLEKIHFYVI